MSRSFLAVAEITPENKTQSALSLHYAQAVYLWEMFMWI